jgi:hypothetical protein
MPELGLISLLGCWRSGRGRPEKPNISCQPDLPSRYCRPLQVGSLGLGDQSHSCTLGWRDAKRTSCPSMQTASPLISSCVRCIRPSRDAGVPGLEGSLFDPPASQRPKPAGRTCFRESSVIGSAMPPTYASTAPITGSHFIPRHRTACSPSSLASRASISSCRAATSYRKSKFASCTGLDADQCSCAAPGREDAMDNGRRQCTTAWLVRSSFGNGKVPSRRESNRASIFTRPRSWAVRTGCTTLVPEPLGRLAPQFGCPNFCYSELYESACRSASRLSAPSSSQDGGGVGVGGTKKQTGRMSSKWE